MGQKEGACLICGEPIVYYETSREMNCEICGKSFASNASCTQGHFVCDQCHSQQGIAAMMEQCLTFQGKNPLVLLQSMMEHPYIHMHGPEHHILVGAALLTAYRNCGGEVDLEQALKEMIKRGKKVPGGICGFWGCCGAAVSSGIFVSIVTGSTPLSKEPWGLSNEMTSRSLKAISGLGGPRCCKRNSFTTIRTAVAFVKEHFQISMELPKKILCDFSHDNHQCIGKRCPYHKSA